MKPTGKITSMDTVFRTKAEENTVERVPEAKASDVTEQSDSVDVPYTDIEASSGHPYTVEYFDLGDTYEVFNDEIGVIESFLQNKIKSGDIANTKNAVERELKMIEKINNIKDEERSVVKIGVLAEYIRFLTNTRNI